ncbi:MAG: cytochrome c biogenesis protein ResB [Bacteroidaceae bacterium]|nr:cytochrome c biogenesis protein ResB [Bacteroidaceae bacterium]
MWTKPWKLNEGFLIGGGLIVTGLMLELVVGPVVWEALAWPVNIIVLAVLLILLVMAFLLQRRVYALRFMGTTHAAVPALCYAVVLTAIMGLTRQTVNGTWINNMLTFWPFVLIYVWLAVILSLVVLRRLRHFQLRRDIPFLLIHLGLFISLVCATLGSADMQRLKMITVADEPEWRALRPEGTIVELPIAIELKQFIMEQYDDGSPRRFASDIIVLTKSGKNFSATVDVNHPVEVEGWKIYQYGYDTSMGVQSKTSILELVRDPWLPAVYVGIWMMLLGAVCMFVVGVRNKRGKE